MTTKNNLFGVVNIFPAISPLIVMISAYVYLASVERKQDHELAVTIATIFTYGILFLIPLSYFSFKMAVLPFLNWLPNYTKVNSYIINCLVFLTLSLMAITVGFGCISIFKIKTINMQIVTPIFELAFFITAFIALNCMGHIFLFRFCRWIDQLKLDKK